CAKQNWVYASIHDTPSNALSRTVTLGDRKVLVDLPLEPPKPGSPGMLRTKLQAAGAKPLEMTFPNTTARMLRTPPALHSTLADALNRGAREGRPRGRRAGTEPEPRRPRMPARGRVPRQTQRARELAALAAARKPPGKEPGPYVPGAPPRAPAQEPAPRRTLE